MVIFHILQGYKKKEKNMPYGLSAKEHWFQ